MQLQQLAYFVAVAEVRHFTRAAETLRVAQPSLSKQIRTLEDELGAPLFSRARGNITLTPAGEALLPLARRILADVETARREVQDLTGLRRGRVRLGATPSLFAGLLADALARFRRRYPGIELHVEEGGSRDLVRDLARGHLDLALIILPLQSTDPALETAPILREDLVVVSARSRGAPARVPADRGPARPAAGDVPQRLRPARGDAGGVPAGGLRADVRRGGRRDGRRAALRRGRARAGRGAVDGARRAARAWPARPSRRPGLQRTIALAHRKDVHPTHAAQAFHETLLGFLSDAEAGGDLPPGVERIG